MQKKLLQLLVAILLCLTFTNAFSQKKTYLVSEVAIAPDFYGGPEMLQQFIANNYEMPEDAAVFGQIEIGFTVDAKGKLSNFEIVKDLGSGTGAEALRIFTICPKWKPGRLDDGTPVNVYFILPIKLQSR